MKHPFQSLRVIVPALLACPALAGSPDTPIFNEPRTVASGSVDPSDVHMEVLPFGDPDGDAHLSTDWEIRTDSGEVVWQAPGITGPSRTHTHFADGTFVNSLAGASRLEPNTMYTCRVRFRDDSGQPDALSEWATREFLTGSLSQSFPLEFTDVLTNPPPAWKTAGTNDTVALPAGVDPGRLVIDNTEAAELLRLVGTGSGVTAVDQPSLEHHHPIRLVVIAGSDAVSIPESDLELHTEDGFVPIFLPAISLNAGDAAYFWVSTNGSTYFGTSTQTEPDLTSIARGNPLPWATTKDFTISRFATGFQLPVNIAFANNPGTEPGEPFFYVSELYGKIKVVDRFGTVSTYAENILNYDPQGGFPGAGELGLTGLCVDPTNGDLFATTVFQVNTSGESAGKVIRFTSTDGGRTAATSTDILQMVPGPMSPSHQISNISFGPDGYLYVHVGDAFEFTAWSNLDDWRAKIHRMTRAGQPVAANPFYSTADGINARDYTFAYGMRNPFGGAWRSSDQSHYIIHIGPGVDGMMKLVRGRNYGYSGSDASMYNFAIYNWNPGTAPVNIDFLQQSRFNRSGFPADYEGRAYISQSGPTYAAGPSVGGAKLIQEMVISPTAQLVEGPRDVAWYTGPGRSTAVPIAAGPDGLYFGDFYPEIPVGPPWEGVSSIFRLSYNIPTDCDNNNVYDPTQIDAMPSLDCDGDRVIDSCAIADGSALDCDNNGQSDFCQATQVLTENFDAVPGLPFTINNDAVVQNGSINFPDGDDPGSITLDPQFAGPVSRIRAAFDFAIFDEFTYRGICFAVMDADVHGPNAAFGEDGPGLGSVSVTFDPRAPNNALNRVVVRVDGVVVLEQELTYSLNEGVFRRAEVALVDDHLTLRLVNNNNVRKDIFIEEHLPGFQPFRARLGWGSGPSPGGDIRRIDNINVWVPNAGDADADGLLDGFDCTPAGGCNDLDFNNDGVTPDTLDIMDFLGVFGGGACSNDPNCDPIDFNNDGVTPDNDDIEDFLRVFGGGEC
jgi:glucose/arabinose dehydrogenase